MWNGRRRCPGHSGEGFLQERQKFPPVPPRSKSRLPLSSSPGWEQGGPLVTLGMGYSQPAGEMRVKMGDQRRNPWGCGAGRELTDPQFPALLPGAHSTALLCVLGVISQTHCTVLRAHKPPACSHLIPEGWKGPTMLCQAGQVLSLLQGAPGASRDWGVPLGSCGGGCQSPGVEINKIRNALAAGLGSAYRGSTETL